MVATPMYGKFTLGAESYGNPRKILLCPNLHQPAQLKAASGAWKTADGVRSFVLSTTRPRVRIHNQNMTTAAKAHAERKTFGHLS